MGTAILIGYWRYPEEFPDPVRFIDPTWASSERRLVADFLERCTSVNQYRGLSVCRFCARFNGSAEMTDGVYCWPEGLAHYVKRHLVRLPAEFVRHVHRAQNPLDKAPRPSVDERGQRDPSWPGSEFGPPIWQPEDSADRYPHVEVDATWWLSQQGLPDTDVESCT